MTESSPSSPRSGRVTLHSLALELSLTAESADQAESMLEDRIIALEELLAARWPRRALLRRRLARRLRASAAAHAYAGRSFAARRVEAASEDIRNRTRRLS